MLLAGTASFPAGDRQRSETSVGVGRDGFRTPTPFAFVALRHPNTVDTAGPYPVSVRQLSGPDVSGGTLVYSVSGAGGRKTAERRVPLRFEGSENLWIGEITGEPVGSTIMYAFEMTAHDGELLRHPARATAVYRFSVVSCDVVSVTAGDPKERPRRVVVRFRSGAPVARGALVARVRSGSSDVAREFHIALSPVAAPHDARIPLVRSLQGPLPEVRPGELVDFYFDLRTVGGDEFVWPVSPPSQVYTIKHQLRAVHPITSDWPFVLDIRGRGRERWIGLKGGGVWMQSPQSAGRRWGLGEGLPSGIARFVLPDPVLQRAYVGTDGGVVAIEPDGESWSITTSWPSAGSTGLESPPRLGRGSRAGPAALSTLDGTLLFQLQGEAVLEEGYPRALFFKFRDGDLSEWKPSRSGLPIVGLSSATFDPIDGCWLLGAFAASDDRRLLPVVVQDCGGTSVQLPVSEFIAAGALAQPQRVVALARDPATGTLVAGLEFAVLDRHHRRTAYGVYHIDPASGALSPLTVDLAALDVEVTSLATDWSHACLLVGTWGRGLLRYQSGSLRPVAGVDGADITTVQVHEENSSLLVGTSNGAFELSNDGRLSTRLGPPASGVRLSDALPADVNSATGIVLLSSNSQGLFQLARSRVGGWDVVQSLRSGRDIPGGLLGDAQFVLPTDLSAVLYGRGLLLVEAGQSRVLTPADGLHGVNPLRLLTRRSGDLWLSFSPMPFTRGGAVQILRDGSVVRTIELGDRNLATIGRWVEVPARNSVFAATRAGVIEVREDGSITLLSGQSASSIARDPHTGAIGVVGTAVERWTGKQFVPVLFRVDHPRWQRDKVATGNPIDVAIDRGGTWYLLFDEGILVLLDPGGGFVGLLDPEDGVPPTARRLLAHPKTGEVFVGSDGEGLVVVAAGEQ